MLPEPNFHFKPDEFIGRQAYRDAFKESLRHNAVNGRVSTFRILRVRLAVSKDVSDYMKFAEVLCDRLAHVLLTSDSLATRIRTKIKNWKLTRVNVGALTVDHQPRRFFLSSGSALLRHTPVEAWNQFSRLEQGKFNTDLAQLSEKEIALLQAVAHKDEVGTSSITRGGVPSLNRWP